MKKELPLFLLSFCIIISAFSQEKVEKDYWYTSPDNNGYISIQKIDLKNENSVSTTINTTVRAKFDNEILNFNLSTINDGDKMVSPTNIIFDGIMDSNMKHVSFKGNRIKMDRKNASYWYFDGDFKNEMETDPDFKSITRAKHNATLKFPDRTIPTFNLWAIIPNLPFERSGTFIFNALDETKLYVKKDQTVNYLGQYKTNIKGENIVLHKFVHQGKGMLPAYFWVNDNRELVQVLLDNQYTFTLSSKEDALRTKTLVAAVNND